MERIRVLYFADTADLEPQYRPILSNAADIEVVTARNGQTGWRTLEEEDIDCIVCDIGRAEGDGLAFLERLDEAERDLPVILLTGDLDPDCVEFVLALDIDDYLPKSLIDTSPDTLVNIVKTLAVAMRADFTRSASGSGPMSGADSSRDLFDVVWGAVQSGAGPETASRRGAGSVTSTEDTSAEKRPMSGPARDFAWVQLDQENGDGRSHRPSSLSEVLGRIDWPAQPPTPAPQSGASRNGEGADEDSRAGSTSEADPSTTADDAGTASESPTENTGLPASLLPWPKGSFVFGEDRRGEVSAAEGSSLGEHDGWAAIGRVDGETQATPSGDTLDQDKRDQSDSAMEWQDILEELIDEITGITGVDDLSQEQIEALRRRVTAATESLGTPTGASADGEDHRTSNEELVPPETEDDATTPSADADSESTSGPHDNTDDIDIEEHSLDTETYHRPDDLELDDGTSVLVQCGSQDDRSEHACHDLLGLEGEKPRNVLLIRYRQLDPNRLQEIATTAEETKVVSIGYAQPVPQPIADRVDTVKINNPNDVMRLGILVSGILQEWSASAADTVVCYHPLDVLLRYKTVESSFRFLHLFLGNLQTAGVISHFHVDPSAGDPQEINTLKPLFDEVITIDSVGTHLEV